MPRATSPISTPRSPNGSTTILAQVGSGGLKLADIVAGEGAALLTTLTAAPGEVKTEILDIDLKTRGGRTVPARLFHKVAFGADGAPGASRTLVLNRARDDGTDPQRAAEVRFMRFFHNTPMAIATVDREGRIVRSNALFARLFNPVLKGEGADGRSILAVVAERDRGALEAAIRKAAQGQGEIAPVDAALDGAGERFARFYVTAVEEEERDQEAAIVYALETTEQQSAGEPDQPVAEDGDGRPARRRHRARLQQRARRHHDGDRFPGERPQADRSRRSRTSSRSGRTPTARPPWCGSCSPSRASRRCARRCSISARWCPT